MGHGFAEVEGGSAGCGVMVCSRAIRAILATCEGV
jgi:hypothetical protein